MVPSEFFGVALYIVISESSLGIGDMSDMSSIPSNISESRSQFGDDGLSGEVLFVTSPQQSLQYICPKV